MYDALADYSFISCEFPYCAFVRAAYEADSEEERRLLISFLIRYIDFVVSSGKVNPETEPGFGTYVDALNAVRYCLRDRIVQDEMWKWLWPKIPVLSFEEQSAFAVGVLCPILSKEIRRTDPREWDDPHEMIALDRLLQCYRDSARKWAVLEGFTESNFEQASRTLARYNQWRRQQGLDPLAVDSAELEEYLRQFGGPTNEEADEEENEDR